VIVTRKVSVASLLECGFVTVASTPVNVTAVVWSTRGSKQCVCDVCSCTIAIKGYGCDALKEGR